MRDDATDPRAEFLVEPEWLAARLEEPSVRVIDCGERVAYGRAHIPGAASLLAATTPALVADGNWLKNPDDPLHVLDADQAAAVFGALGIGDATTVVAYDAFNGSHATRLWWVLRYYGHADARLLDGGWQHWLEAGLPVSCRAVTPEATTFTPRPDATTLATLDEVKRRHADTDVQVVNVLWPDWYTGAADPTPFGNPRVGHIPASVNVPIELFLQDTAVPTLKPAAELREVLEAAGLDAGRETIVHCQAGVRTTMGVFALTLAGWGNVRAFDGSLAEWSRDPTAPLVTGNA